MILFAVFILSLFLTISMVPIMKSMAFKMNIVDVPNGRKVHELPMPRSGGISMAIGFFVPVFLWLPRNNFVSAVILGSIVIVVSGIIDDIKNIRPREKFSAQIVAALIVIFYGGLKIKYMGSFAPDGFVLPNSLSIALTLMAMVGITNAINLSDGLDGLAGGISMLSFVCIGFLAYKNGNAIIAIMSVAIAGAILGFLRYNTHPATIFMGDAGSQLLGFLSVTFALTLTQSNTPYGPALPLLLIGFPILDTLTVMLTRIARGISPFKADKQHFHHRLMRLGLYHSEAVFGIYMFQAVFISAAVVFRYYSDWVNLLFFLFFSGLIIIGFTLAGRKGWQVKRGYFLETVVKGRLRRLKERKISIKTSFRAIEWGLPLLFFFHCLIPRHIPLPVSITACGLILLMLGDAFTQKFFRSGILRTGLYLMIPFLIFYGETDPAAWMTRGVRLADSCAFVAIVMFVILTMNLTRRKKGIKITPLDFLVFFMILILPNLPSTHFECPGTKIMVAKILVFFFSYDVLLGELRGQNRSLALASMLALGGVALRGFL
jgi:UDP-GlcNAc:undecaprenyl-phosphate GlcNAc-1-phosphate transferase